MSELYTKDGHPLTLHGKDVFDHGSAFVSGLGAFAANAVHGMVGKPNQLLTYP
jgi:hypothetical protein